MSGRITAVFGGIVLLAVAGLDYGAAANGRPAGRPLGVAEHVLDRIGQAKAALGFPAPAATAPITSVGQAMAAIQSALDQASGDIRLPVGDTPPDLAAAVASGDTKAVTAMAETAFAGVAAGIEDGALEAAPKAARAGKAHKITLGIGTCAKRGAGTFCSLGD